MSVVVGVSDMQQGTGDKQQMTLDVFLIFFVYFTYHSLTHI